MSSLKNPPSSSVGSVIDVESIWCPDCNEIRPVKHEYMKGLKNNGNDHDATDILCDQFHVIATLHHPHALAKFLGMELENSIGKK